MFMQQRVETPSNYAEMFFSRSKLTGKKRGSNMVKTITERFDKDGKSE